MNDAEEGQSASGSWQPDPTGRYKLRWRNEAGDWTAHVYSDDGEMGNDPYDAPTEQPPPTAQPPSAEPPSAPQSEPPEASDTAPRTMVCDRCGHTDFVAKRDRVLWHVCFWLLLWYVLPFLRKRPYCARCGMRSEWLNDEKKPKPPIYRRWWAFALYGFVILIVIAILADVDEDEESAESAPPTEQTSSESETGLAQAPTTAAPTTTRPTTTTQSLASGEEDCAIRSSLLGMLSGEVGGHFEELSLQSAIGDIEGMQETYGIIAWAMADLPDMTRETIEICRPYAPQEALDEIESNFAIAEAGWRELQQACRSDLAPLGFDCETGTLGYSTSAATSPGADAEAAAELTARERTCADNWETISYSEMLSMKRDRSIDGIYDWSGGYWVSYDKIMDFC